MRTTTKTTLASLVATGGVDLTVSSDAGIDAALVRSVRDALTARGLTTDAADLTTVVAPADQIVDGGDAAVMAVSLSAGDLDPTQEVQGKDWAPALWTDGANPINALLDTACGLQESEPALAATPVEEPAGEPAAPGCRCPGCARLCGRVPAAPAAPLAVAPAAPAAPAAAPTVDRSQDTQAVAASSDAAGTCRLDLQGHGPHLDRRGIRVGR